MAEAFDYVVVGNSAAGLQAIRTLRKHAADVSVAIIDREDLPAYSRVLTPYFVGGKTGLDDLFIVDRDYYRQLGITTLFGRTVIMLDADGHQLELDDGRCVSFGKLLLATGAEAHTLEVKSDRSSPLRHRADAERLAALMQHARSITAIGAGLVSLPLLSHAPASAEKHLVVGSNRIFSRVVDAQSSAILEARFAQSGLQLHKEDDILAIEEGERLTLQLASGGSLTCDMLIVGKGVVPNSGLARTAGLQVNYGVLIDDYCRTSHADIYAAGDAAEGRDFVTGEPIIQGNWLTAVEQGENAALNMLGKTCAYEGSLKNNITEVFGVDIAAIGCCLYDTAQTVSSHDQGTGRYRKVFLNEQQQVVGAVLIGETNDAGLYYNWIRTRARFPGKQFLNRTNTYAGFQQRMA
ncbi:MAG: FAD-dependent oxidoreductase [Desulfuromonadales bacterium]|nr:FAD-dependent oxidoreductase [Desulfuromonadales bacterium]